MLALFVCKSFGQRKLIKFESPVYAIDSALRLGDKNALFKIAPYFDSDKKLTEFLGYHILSPKESQVAKRIVRENCIFDTNQIIISEKTTGKDFLSFLDKYSNKITFSELAGAFLITPLSERYTEVKFRKLSADDLRSLQNTYADISNKGWVTENKIDSLLKSKDPKALLVTVSAFFRKRYRFNTYNYDQAEYIGLIQLFTGLELGVLDERNEISWHPEKSFYPDVALNLLAYFSQNYSKFRWNSSDSTFKNSDIEIIPATQEDTLFSKLKSEDDTIALNAFIQLTTASIPKVTALANEFEKSDIDANNIIPIFPYRFLRQIVLLTQYDKENNIDFQGSPSLRSAIESLKQDISFQERRRIEDSLISTLSLEQIDALEYWALVNESSYGITYSAGRILDKLYSRPWNELVSNSKYLRLYLKKSYLFQSLGIIGSCNNYLKKFIGKDTSVFNKLNLLNPSDSDMIHQAGIAKLYSSRVVKKQKDDKKFNDGNGDFEISNLADKINKLKKNWKPHSDEKKFALQHILAEISYNQIDTALAAIEDMSFGEHSWEKYSFMERDWGFFLAEHFDSAFVRNDFLKLYHSLSEYELYAYFLDKAGIDYKDKNGSLDYDKIFEILKYNVVTAFVGGGGGKQDNEVYAVIKLLELTSKTTLGYPKKLCNSRGIYGCSSDRRAAEWMQFFIDHKYLKMEHKAPVSFQYE